MSVIKYCINGLPRSEISEITGISTGSVSNSIKNWKESVEEIPDIEDIKGFMKQVYKTDTPVKKCAQGFKLVQMMNSFYNNEIEDAEVSNLFWSFINDIYNSCKVWNSTILHPWLNKRFVGFFSHPNRQNDIAFSSNAQNESDKQSNSIKLTKPNRNPNPSSSQLSFPYNIEKLGIKQISHAKEENLQYEYSTPDRSHDRKYLIIHLNISFISKVSSIINTKKKECMKL